MSEVNNVITTEERHRRNASALTNLSMFFILDINMHSADVSVDSIRRMVSCRDCVMSADVTDLRRRMKNIDYEPSLEDRASWSHLSHAGWPVPKIMYVGGDKEG